MRKEPQTLLSAIQEKQSKIRESFKNPQNLYQYISYEQFFKHFQVNEGNYKSENLNVIDVHLRYRWFVREKMAAYKWIPIACMTPILFQNFWLIVIIPYFTVKMFDHYFQSFFIWRYKKERIINVRKQFATKLSKQTSFFLLKVGKMRRIKLFEALQQGLERKNEVKDSSLGIEHPLKYIKFADYTEYIFHAVTGDKEQSSILQTTIFQTFLDLQRFIFGFSQFNILKQIVADFANDFIQFKKDDNRTKYHIDTKILLDRQQIKDIEVYSLQDNFDHNIRRFSELWGYEVRGNLEPSNFKLWEYTNFSKFEDIFEPYKYNIKDNSADLLLYYSILAIPKLFKIIFKRR